MWCVCRRKHEYVVCMCAYSRCRKCLHPVYVSVRLMHVYMMYVYKQLVVYVVFGLYILGVCLFECMCMFMCCVCVHVWGHVCVHVLVLVYMVFVWVCVCASVSARHVYVCTWTCACMCLCVYMCVYWCVYAVYVY